MKALDLFAGTGWGVACDRLGVEEFGVELMDAAVETRAANGMQTIFRDVWDGLVDPSMVPDHDLLIASPPCQTFSMAGKGAGRKALDDVRALIESRVHEYPERLRALTQEAGFDDRTALVLTPLAYVVQWLPRFVTWEQVPTVLPVWEACAEVLRALGYSVQTGLLHAEQYGVPQTRKRAILVARRDGQAAQFPVPTHSRYYSKSPSKLDAGLLRWVSMAEALGWGMDARPYPTISTGAGTAGGGTDPAALGGSGARRLVYAERSAGRWVESGDADNDGGVLRLSADQAATIQSYPTGWGFTDRPAVTVGNAVGRGLIGGSGAKQVVLDAMEAGSWIDSPHGDGSSYGERTRIHPAEAGMLQSYERPFVWCGTRTQQFLQIGNAVPPLMAQAVLSALVVEQARPDEALFSWDVAS